MSDNLGSLWKNEHSQDLIEYTLILAFIALVAAGLLIQVGTRRGLIGLAGR